MNKTTKIVYWLVLIVIFFLVIWYGMSRNSTSQSNTIKIGAILSLTGNYSDIGQEMRDGITLAQEEINLANKERKVDVVFQDGQNDPKVGLADYKQMADVNGLKIFIVAHSNVSTAIAQASTEGKDKNLIFNVYANVPKLTAIGDYIFRNDIRVQDETQKLAEFVESQNYKRTAVLALNTGGAIALAETFKSFLDTKNTKIVSDERYAVNETDFSTVLTKIKNLNPDVIFFTGAPKQAGLILKKAFELGIEAKFISTSQCEGNELLSIAGNAANGIIYTQALDLSSNDTKIKQFVTDFRNQFKIDPDYRAALAYDSVKMLFNSAANCPQNDTDCIKNNLLQVKNYEGITGPTTIGADRDTSKFVFLKTVKDGKFVLYQ